MRKETCFDENYVECSEIFDKGWVPKENYYLIRYEPENAEKKKKDSVMKLIHNCL